jgi:hypothetical protein
MRIIDVYAGETAEIKGDGRNCRKRSFMICTVHRIPSG